MRKPKNPTEKSVDILIDHLRDLEKDEILSSEQDILRKIISRSLELKDVFERIFDPRNVVEYHEIGGLKNSLLSVVTRAEEMKIFSRTEFENELRMERRRLLAFIVTAAADGPARYEKRRCTRSEAALFLDELGRHAKALKDSLERIERRRWAIPEIPGWVFGDLFTLLEEAAPYTHHEGFQPKKIFSVVSPQLSELYFRNSRYWPDLADILEPLASVDGYMLDEETTGRNPLPKTLLKKRLAKEFSKALPNDMDDDVNWFWKDTELLRPFEFTPKEIDTLTDVCLHE